MSILLAGLFFLGVGIFIGASVQFLIRLYRENFAWGLAATVLPPIGLIPFTSYLQKYSRSACALLAGVYLALVSGVLWARMNPEPLQWQPLLLSRWLTPWAAGAVRYESAFPKVKWPGDQVLAAKVLGEKQRWQLVEWTGETLRFASSDMPIPQTMVQIKFPESMVLTGDKRHLHITPNQLDVPVVEIFSGSQDSKFPKITVLKQGYWLDIDLEGARENRISGRIMLALPQRYKTWVAGEFSAYTDGVRYVNNELDRRHDSAETLARVAISHVNANLWQWLETTPTVDQLHFQSVYEPLEGRALVHANIAGMGRVDVPVKFRKDTSGWFVVPDVAPMLAANLNLQKTPPAAGRQASEGNKLMMVSSDDSKSGRVDIASEAPDQTKLSNTVAIEAASAHSLPARPGPTSAAPADIKRFSDLRYHIGQMGDLFTYDGRKIQGILKSVDGEQLKLQRTLQQNALTLAVSSANFAKFVPHSRASD